MSELCAVYSSDVYICVEFVCLSVVVSVHSVPVFCKAVFGPIRGVGQQLAQLFLSSPNLSLKGRTSLPHKVWRKISLLRGPSGSGADSPTNYQA